MKSTKTALVFILLVAATSMTAQTQSTVFVPGTASGAFGYPLNLIVPFVPAITVNGPGTITITYVDGTVTGPVSGPNGVRWGPYPLGSQLPLQEAKGVAGGWVDNLNALIGAFVPAARVNHAGFTAIDGTKAATRVGIMPNKLFFIGESITLEVKEAGTLFLGVNDNWVTDNGGGFTVEVTGP